MFIDKVQIDVKAGDGGNGIVSFRHEKFIDKGGPDGGDGGHGGSVIFKASRNQNTLASFRYQRLLTAEPGQPGSKRRKHGKNGTDLVVEVPVGTVLSDTDGEVLADLQEDGQTVVIAKGGRGGFGNAHFVSSTRQAPRIAEKGEPGDQFQLTAELKMIADVGLVGLPNAGKSTLLASVSNARPEIANYPFTTLKPNLGMVPIDEEATLLFADIPGLIEGASQGKGLGDEFLRHVERTAVLLHLIDSYNEDLIKAYTTIQEELRAYKVDLTERPQIIALNKIDGLDDEIIEDRIKELRTVVPEGTEIHAISAQSKKNLPQLLYAIKAIVMAERSRLEEETEPEAGLPVLRMQKPESWHLQKQDHLFLITGPKIERFARRTDFASEEGLGRLRDIMKKMGIQHELMRQGIEPGDRIVIGAAGEFEY